MARDLFSFSHAADTPDALDLAESRVDVRLISSVWCEGMIGFVPESRPVCRRGDVPAGDKIQAEYALFNLLQKESDFERYKTEKSKHPRDTSISGCHHERGLWDMRRRPMRYPEEASVRTVAEHR